MSMFVPRNGAPINNKSGMQDNSIAELVREAIGDPIHKPLIYTFAPRGVDDEAFPVTGDNLFSMFGRNIFDYRSDYATFNTPFASMFNANANECMYQRLVPDDAKISTLRFYLEVLKTKTPKYVREDGEIKYDNAGQPVVESEIDGVQIVLRKEVIQDGETDGFKAGLVKDGTLTDADGGTSKLYPIMDIKAPYAGKDCDGFGFRFSPLHSKAATAILPSYQKTVGARVYSLQVVETLAGVTTPVIWKTINGLSSVRFAFKKNAYYEPLKTELDFNEVVPTAYRNTTPEIGMLPEYGPFEEIYFYADNYEDVLTEAYAAMLNPPESEYLIDVFGGVDLDGNPYDGLQVNPSTVTGNAVFSTKNTHFLSGGSDGTMGNDAYDELVRREMLLFPGDGKVSYDNELKYSLGIFYDSGFTFATKSALTNFIAGSRNTFLCMSTHVYNEGRNDLQAEESAKVSAIELIRAIPESDEYGTPSARGILMGQTCRIRNSSYKEYVPALYSLANLFSKYCGAKNGYCKPEYRFNRGSKTVLEDIVDLSMPWKGNVTYASDWDVSLVSARSYDYHRVFIPAIQSVYSDDRSVLTNALFNFLMTYVYRVTDRVWADITGENRVYGNEIAQEIEKEITSRLDGRLDGNCSVTPNAYFTAADIANGRRSITIDIDSEGANLLTQFNTTIRVFARSN